MNVDTALNISRTNALVGQQERAVFDALAKQCQEELPLLRQKVEETKRLLAMLEEKLTETEQGVLVCQSLSTPSHIRRLPPELLALVFTFACAGDVFHVFPRAGKSLPTCYTLVRVCKYWRDLAFGTKAIWNHCIFIKDTGPHNTGSVIYDYGPSEEIAVLERVVELYGKNLTRLHIDCLNGINVEEGFFELVFGAQDQLISLALVHGEFIFPFTGTFKMPRLEELFLPGWVSNRGVYDRKALVEFVAPNLKRVFLHCPDVDPSAGYPSLPWHQISHLSLGSPCTMSHGDAIIDKTLCDLLTQLPRLESLHFSQFYLKRWDSDKEPSVQVQPIIANNHLKHIELYDPSLDLLAPRFEDDCSLLPRISTPSLETFDLFFQVDPIALYHGKHELHNVLIPFFQRTPSLRQIRLVLMQNGRILGRSYQSSPASFLQFTGKATLFTLLSRVITEDEGDNSFVELSERRRVPEGHWLSWEETWTDKLIDRYINQFPVIPWPMERNTLISASEETRSTCKDDDPNGGEHDDASSQQSADEDMKEFHYEAEERETMKAIFAMLGDAGIPSHIQRHVYLAF